MLKQCEAPPFHFVLGYRKVPRVAVELLSRGRKPLSVLIAEESLRRDLRHVKQHPKQLLKIIVKMRPNSVFDNFIRKLQLSVFSSKSNNDALFRPF